MGDIFEGFSEEITRWDLIREIADLDLDEKQTESKQIPSVQLLPRQDVMLYGRIPKMEQKIYSKCKECRLVFNPRDILLHKSCVGKGHIVQTGKDIKKKVKSKKKNHSQSLSSAPVFKKPASPHLLSSTITADINATVSSSTHIDSNVCTKEKEKEKERDKDREREKDKHKIIKEKEVEKEKEKESSSSIIETKSSVTSPSSSYNSSSSTGSPTSSANSGSKFKKPRKSTKITKDYDPDVHCGVMEGSKGPCTRSITCSNHRIQLRKLVPGRSKDIHQLILERKSAKEKDLKSPSSCYMPLNLEEKEIFCQNTCYVPIVASASGTVVNNINTTQQSPTLTTFVPIMPKPVDVTSAATTVSCSRQISTSSKISNAVNKDMNMITDSGIMIQNSKVMLENGCNSLNIHQNHSQDSAIGTVPVVYMPMSPISVVSPVQFVQIGKNMICLESPQSAMSPPLPNQSVYLTIPEEQHDNVKIYKSHPKPVTIPTYNTRRVGGAIVISKQRLERQRNDILKAIESKRRTTNSSAPFKGVSVLNMNTPHRPNILKVKSLTKTVNYKRDKVNSSESKKIRLAPDVNGFILHADMSESAEAPQPNNCIQEKIALLNMK